MMVSTAKVPSPLFRLDVHRRGTVTRSPPRAFAWHRNNDVGSGGFVGEFGDHR